MRPQLTVITPAWREAQNLPVLHGRLCEVIGALGVDWEWVVVDDHSPDDTFAVIRAIAAKDPHVRGLRFSRNYGSHTALTCGIKEARGECVIAMAADLQDPPETIPDLLAKWREGAQVVWAVRAAREGESRSTVGFANLYYWLMRNVVGMKEMPSTGADFFLLDARVAEAFSQFNESNVSMMALITWMGFRQSSIFYTKQARLHGSSGWNLEKKFKLVIDSITSFTYLPIRWMTYVGFVTAFLGFLYAAWVIGNAILVRQAPTGYPSLIVVVTLLGGLQMIMLGVLGEYLWRALDEARRRPRYLIEEIAGNLPVPLNDHVS